MDLITPAVVFLQGVGITLAAPLTIGLLNKVRARAQGRKGPSILQPYRNIFKDLRKESLVTEGSTWIFRSVPALIFAIYVAVVFSLPVVINQAVAGFEGEILMIVFLIALARFMLALAALDTGTSFAGLGASREMSLSSLVEPTTILSVFAIALVSGTTSLQGIVGEITTRGLLELGAPHALAFAALFVVLIAETGRIPVDNPATHLELTMIHEAMVLEYSGWRLALIEWAGAVKLSLYLCLLISIFVPWGIAADADPLSLFLALGLFVVKAVILLLAVALLEASIAKLRFFRLPDLIGSGMMLAILAVVTVYIGLG